MWKQVFTCTHFLMQHVPTFLCREGREGRKEEGVIEGFNLFPADVISAVRALSQSGQKGRPS